MQLYVLCQWSCFGSRVPTALCACARLKSKSLTVSGRPSSLLHVVNGFQRYEIVFTLYKPMFTCEALKKLLSNEEVS